MNNWIFMLVYRLLEIIDMTDIVVLMKSDYGMPAKQ